MITCNFEDGGKASLRHMVVHAIVESNGKILLEKRSDSILEGGKWSLPSGFMNRDENAQEAMVREIKEETGWIVKIVCLFRVNANPKRPHEDRQNVALEFIATAVEKVGDGDWESTEIRWFALDELPQLDTLAFDHGETLRLYLSYKKQKFPLPILV